MNNDIRFYISVFFRRAHYFALVAIVFTVAGFATALVLPPKYQADAILLVESAQIPGELASPTVRTSPQEQLEILRQRLLTRATLLDIANENDVFAHKPDLFPDEIVELMRESTEFNISTGRDRASLVTILFTAESPRVAAAVVNAYVTQVQERNIELRTDRAEGTMEFFEQEVQRLSEDLTRKSAEILSFKNENLDSLPENLSYQLSRLDDLRDRASEITREISSIGQQRERLILVYNATGGDSAPGRDLRSPERRQLDEAEAELSTALSLYSDQNPRVKALRARIDKLKATLTARGESFEEGDNDQPPVSVLDIQLSELDNRANLIAGDLESIQEEILKLEASVEAIPGNSVALERLQRDYENIQQQYSTAVARASQAETGERIELLSKGERITILSQPVIPREPSSPNRPLIAGAGIFAGIGAGLGLVLLLELMNRAIRRPVDLSRKLGIAPLGVVPLMRTKREIALRRGIVASVILFATVGIVAAIFYTHTQVMPLDLLASRTLNRIGL